jgi:hypothetical protein
MTISVARSDAIFFPRVFRMRDEYVKAYRVDKRA